MTSPIFLHVTDAHVTGHGVDVARDDHKVAVEGIAHGTREGTLKLLLTRIAERLSQENRKLDAVVFSGDAAERGNLGGHQALLDILLESLGAVGIGPERIVATPGNHDVPRGTSPSSVERYDAFIKAWRDMGCVTPWLDGVDDKTTIDGTRHRLLADDRRWAIFPINSANWSHTTQQLTPPLEGIWDRIGELLPPGDAQIAATLKRQLDSLIRFDMARVSEDQLEVFRRVVEETPPAVDGAQVRIAAMHHHLRTPSFREELKPFADFTNVELLRAALAERRIDVVLHGHKHQHAARRELLDDGIGGDRRRVLVVSGATFDSHNETDAVRTLQLDGLPWTPEVRLTRYAIGRGGLDLKGVADEPISLWRGIDVGAGSTVVHGTVFDDVYQRACAAAQAEANGSTLIVDLDLPPDQNGTMPTGYPAPDALEETEWSRWFAELAGWWQLEHSRLEARVPYHHGSRLHRYAGKLDQIARVRALLTEGATSRALAVLIDPIRDFAADGDGEENFASFCSVQFRKRQVGDRSWVVDVIGYYRAQEFRRWWPINVAELRALQNQVCDSRRTRPGRITTMTAEARAIGRSPTEVSVPLIDRWLDQHPGRLFLLATYLAGGVAADSGRMRNEVVSGWMQSLADFDQATKEFNPDGVPLAIEGIQALADYVDSLNPAGDLRRFSRSLRALATANCAYAATKQKEADFRNWGASVHIDALRALSVRLLGIDGASAV
jgi:3',5'-cyclic AMP phosphodiesterase CpdA